MSLTYTTYVAQLSNLMVVDSNNANFQTFLPGCIDYAEQRIYRELDLLATRVTDNSSPFVASNRLFTLPTAQGTFLVVEEVNAVSTGSSTRYPLVQTSRPVIDALYPSNSMATGVPEFFAMVNNASIIVGPAPDQAYTAEVIGTQRPTALSSTNTSTILTTMLPDLFMAASMVFASAYQRDFGGQSDDPRMSASWEAQYTALKGSALVEEVRKKCQAEGWTNALPSPVATPARV